MKAISAIIVVVLLLLISISLISVVYVWSSALTGTVTSTTEETATRVTESSAGVIRVDSVHGHSIYLKNIGTGDLSDIRIFIDDNPVIVSKILVEGIEADKIPEGKLGEVVINVTGVPINDRMKLKVLASGSASQTVFIEPMENLIDNPGFEDGVWSNAGDCCCGACSCNGGTCTSIPGGSGCGSYAIPPSGGCNALFTAFTAGGYEGKSLNLTGANACACNAMGMNNFQPGKTYTLSFRYKHIRGNGAWFCVWVSGCNNCKPVIPTGTLTSTSWDSYTITFKPEPCTTNLSPFFYSGGTSEVSENLYDNIYLIEGFRMA